MEQLRNEDAMLIKEVTFEGRHTEEMGIEFDVDIDLLPEAPYYTCTVHTSHELDITVDLISRTLKQKLKEKLWKLSGKGCRGINFTPDSLANLVRLYVEHMQR